MSIAQESLLFQGYYQALFNFDKSTCVRLAVDALESGEVSIIDLYQELLSPVLNQIVTSELGSEAAIWKEHVRSEITRTAIECCYPYVLKELAIRRANTGISVGDRGKVLIVLPSEEYHELGARMGVDFFLLNGFETLFVGGNTPRESVLSGIAHFQPDFVDLHVVNYYNLFKAKELIRMIRDLFPEIKILASGRAFYQDPGHIANIGPVCLIQSYADIESLGEKQL